MSNFKFDDFETSGATGMDALFTREASAKVPRPARVRVASVSQLQGFQRLSRDTLIHKSDRDLWALRKEGDSMFIERLFDDAGTPIKG